MFCPNCKRQVPDNIKYCPHCGELMESTFRGNNDKKSFDPNAYNYNGNNPNYNVGNLNQATPPGKKKMNFLAVCCFCLAAVLALLLVVAINYKSRQTKDNQTAKSTAAPAKITTEGSDNNSGKTSESSKEKVTISSAVTTQETSQKSSDSSSQKNDPYINFDDNDEVTNMIKSPDDFITYHRDDYTVAYPDDFYEYGYSDDEGANFGSSADSLSYSFNRNTYSTVQSAYDAVYSDVGTYNSVENIIVDKLEDGRFIASGRCDGYHGARCSFYYLANITKDHIYTMEIVFPLVSDKDTALLNAYIIDCLYRYCSFNGSTDTEKHTPRSYDDFVASGEYDLDILMEDNGSDAGGAEKIESTVKDGDEGKNASTKCDYSIAADLDNYEYWESPEGDYFFWCPSSMYSDSFEYDDEVYFTSDDNEYDEVSFERLDNELGVSSEDALDTAISDISVDLDGEILRQDTAVKKDGFAHGVICGIGMGGNNEYISIAANESYTYYMYIRTRHSSNEEEKKQMNYYMETMYRYCSFNDTFSPRTYEEYLEDPDGY